MTWIQLDAAGNEVLIITLTREVSRAERDRTVLALHDAMRHRRSGRRCWCGAPWIAGEIPGEKYVGRPGVPAEGACPDGWDVAARLWAAGWRPWIQPDAASYPMDPEIATKVRDACDRWLKQVRS